MVALCRERAKRTGESPRDLMMACIRLAHHEFELANIPDVGTRADDLRNQGYRSYSFCPYSLPGEIAVDEIHLLISPCGQRFFESWSIIEKLDGDEWVPCEPYGDFSEKRRHHFLKAISREEAFDLFRKHLVPEPFQANFAQAGSSRPQTVASPNAEQSIFEVEALLYFLSNDLFRYMRGQEIDGYLASDPEVVICGIANQVASAVRKLKLSEGIE